MVAEDKVNPVIKRLLDQGASFQSASLLEDLSVCISARHFIGGFGSFAPVIYFLGHHQSFHLPNPFLPEKDRIWALYGMPQNVSL